MDLRILWFVLFPLFESVRQVLIPHLESSIVLVIFTSVQSVRFRATPPPKKNDDRSTNLTPDFDPPPEYFVRSRK